MWAAGGLIGRLGAAKRRMLSFAERLSPEEPLTAGAAEGMVAGRTSIDGGEEGVESREDYLWPTESVGSWRGRRHKTQNRQLGEERLT